jgi:hypothetical protein
VNSSREACERFYFSVSRAPIALYIQPPSAAKIVKKGKCGGASRKPLAACSGNASRGGAAAGKAATKKGKAKGKGRGTSGKTVEQIYQKKSQLEHILLRPDSYSEWCVSGDSCRFGALTPAPPTHHVFQLVLRRFSRSRCGYLMKK